MWHLLKAYCFFPSSPMCSWKYHFSCLTEFHPLLKLKCVWLYLRYLLWANTLLSFIYKCIFPVDLRHKDRTSLNMSYRQIKSQAPGWAPPQNGPEMGRIYRASQKEEKTLALSISKRKPPGDKFIAACFMTIFTSELCLLLALTQTELNDWIHTGG